MNSFGSAPRGRQGSGPYRSARAAVPCLVPAGRHVAAQRLFRRQPPIRRSRTAPTPEAQDWLFDVQGTSANNVYACGAKGAMFHFDGTAWSAVDHGYPRCRRPHVERGWRQHALRRRPQGPHLAQHRRHLVRHDQRDQPEPLRHRRPGRRRARRGPGRHDLPPVGLDLVHRGRKHVPVERSRRARWTRCWWPRTSPRW